MTGEPRAGSAGRSRRRRLAAPLLALLGYDLVVRPWMREWGSTREEREMRLPGDDVVADVMTHYTKGVTIDAPPETVWPWLVQIGDRRAGFYSYDWIERFVFAGTVHYAEGTHSATRIHPLHDEVERRLMLGLKERSEEGAPAGTPSTVSTTTFSRS